MQSESSAQHKAASADSNQCPNCHAVMPREMRFCRACGYRMGEGIEEYVETVRLKPRVSAKSPQAHTADTSPTMKGGPFEHQAWGAMSPSVSQQSVNQAQQAVHQATSKLSEMSGWTGKTKKRKGMHWIFWVLLSLLIFSVVSGGIITPIVRKGIRDGAATARARSYAGVNNFSSADGGAFIDYVTPPGGPSDKAGLVGGDVITSFDGKPIKNEEDMTAVLKATPVGKTVEVVFIRDGQTKTTQLTTISRDEMRRLQSVYDNRPEGKGYIGEGTDIDRVIVPGMNIYGVRLNEITKNRPAEISGLKDGDIVIAIGDVPTRTRRELEERIVRAQPYSTVTFTVIRGGERVEVPVRIGIDD